MYIRYETDRHESACVQRTHRLQKNEHFQNRSTRIGVCAWNASSAKVDYFQTGLQKSVCVQVAIGPLHTHRFMSTDLKPVCNIPLVVYREQLELAHVPAPAKHRSAVENCHCASPTSAAAGGPSDTCADFLSHFGLIIDIKNCKLIDLAGKVSVRGFRRSQPSTGIASVSEGNKYRALLSKFPNLVNSLNQFWDPCHSTTRCIVTKGLPAFSRAKLLSPKKLAVVKKEFKGMVEKGNYRLSKSAWSSPIHLVPEGHNEWRICGDYWHLKMVTEPDRCSLPLIQDFSARLHGKIIFSKFHLKRVYHQISVEQSDIPKTAVITPVGLFEYLYMPFGLRNVGQTFQRFIDETFRGIPCFAYLDDILVASSDEQSHLSDLELVFERLNQKGLVLNTNVFWST
ncbi:Retrovirus-related Pol polyprotein from transposon 297 [Araneus ventricosus]|uniref:Retrovirus-related Pol polyprotein from transposon 297 n=1 Tax=Araneus ventricosus TaxID=182803 RepID=A0A4Y2CKU6_ARAVE|nr:Retrovirus-related Pol polyprotein from transposon 297 [Araneus ventricosus]